MSDRSGSGTVTGARPARAPLPAGFWTIWTTVALDLVGFGIVVPILGRYAQRFGAGGLQVGLLFASFSLAQLICSPLLGRLSDRIGRKPVIVISLAGTCIGSLVTGAAGALWLLYLGRIIDGASGASVSVAQAAVTDLAAPADRPRLLGLLGAAFGVGFVLGPAIGGLASLGGTHLPFYVAAAIAGANAVVALVRLPETRPASGAAHGSDEEGAASHGFGGGSARSPILVRYAIVGFVAVFSFSGFESTFALFSEARFALDEKSIAAVFLLIGIVAVVVQGGLIGPLTAKLGSGRLLTGGFALTALGLGALAATGDHDWTLLALGLGLLSVGQGLASPSLTTLVTEHAPRHKRGEALGFQQGASSVARVAGPAVAGGLYQHLAVPAPYALGGVLTAVALVLVVVWHLAVGVAAPADPGLA